MKNFINWEDIDLRGRRQADKLKQNVHIAFIRQKTKVVEIYL